MTDPYLDAPFGLLPQPAPAPVRRFLPNQPLGATIPTAPPQGPRSFTNDVVALNGLPGMMRRQLGYAIPPPPIPREQPRPQPVIAPVGAEPVQPVQVTPDRLRDIIRQTESSGNYQALNPRSSASGAYQYIDSTWGNYGGYPRAALAPKEVQDTKFMLDLNKRLERYGGDPYKVIAAHYLPAIADSPSRWTEPFRVGKVKVSPVEKYVRKVIAGTPLEDSFDEYLQSHAVSS